MKSHQYIKSKNIFHIFIKKRIYSTYLAKKKRKNIFKINLLSPNIDTTHGRERGREMQENIRQQTNQSKTKI